MPTMQPQHAMTAAGKSEIERGYQEIFCDTYFQPLSFKSRSESASRGSNPPGAANTIVLLLYRCLVRTKSHKTRQKAAGSALSVKLEKYLSRPDYEATFRSLRDFFTKDFRKIGIGCRRGIRTPRC